MTQARISVIETLKARFSAFRTSFPSSLAAFRQPGKAVIPLCVGAALVIAVASTLLFWQGDEAWRPLFGRQELYDTAGVVSVLDGQGIPYRLHPDSGQILVSEQHQAGARMQLAIAGITPQMPKGMEVLETDSALGRSQFVEKTRYNQGLEGELAKTIMTLNAVRNARVHLAIPERTAFMRGQSKASASVVLDLIPGMELDHRQVNAVIHLVAGSRSELEPENVSVLDQYGTLLTGQPDDLSLTTRQITHTRQLERQYIERVLNLLEPVVGSGNIRVQATADVDYSIVEKTSEGFDPDSAVVRSESVSSEAMDSDSASGVPGVASNRGGADNAQADSQQRQKSQAVRNFELGRTVSNIREASGEVRKISVAVVVNSLVGGNDGLPADRLALMTALVRDAVGFDEARGDTVTLHSLPFIQPPTAPVATGWESVLQDYTGKPAVDTLSILVFLLVILCVVLLVRVVRLRKRAARARLERVEAIIEPVEMAQPEPVPAFAVGGHLPVTLEQARMLASERPELVAHILKQWIKPE